MAGWYQDKDAGLRFPLPFEGGERKTTEQIQNLILSKPGTSLPTDTRVTSGLYAPAGTPYLLLYTRPESKAPTTAELAEQAFDPARLDKIVDGTESSALKSRTLVVALKDRTSFVGLYYENDADRALLDQVRVGLEVEPGLALDAKKLAAGRPPLGWTIAAALLAAAAVALGYRLWLKQRNLSRRAY